jgi:hypothetical protein
MSLLSAVEPVVLDSICVPLNFGERAEGSEYRAAASFADNPQNQLAKQNKSLNCDGRCGSISGTDFNLYAFGNE